jgi:hypothetical protein
MPDPVSISLFEMPRVFLFFFFFPCDTGQVYLGHHRKKNIKQNSARACNTLIVQGIPDISMILISMLRQELLSRMPLSWREPRALPNMKHVYDFKGMGLQPPSLWQSAGTLNPSQKKTPQ